MHNAEANETEKEPPWLLEAAEALDRAATEEASAAAAAAAAEVALTAAEDAAASAIAQAERRRGVVALWARAHASSATAEAKSSREALAAAEANLALLMNVEDVAQTEEPSWLSDAAAALAESGGCLWRLGGARAARQV